MADADDPDLRDRVAELEATVEAQQETIQQLLPSRRRVLQAGGLVAGGGVLGALTADRASAQASGQVGTSSDPVDVEAYDLAVQNQLTSSVDAGGNDITNVGSVKTEKIGNTRHYAGAYSGTDADARLDNALSAAVEGSVIYLENATYSANRTVSTEVRLIGTSTSDGPTVTGDWTFATDHSGVQGVKFAEGNSTTIDANVCRISDCTIVNVGTITVASGVGSRITDCDNLEVTFQSGASDNVIDSCTRTTVTDNDGGNTIGDIN